MSYAWVAGAAMWLAWLISITFGAGKVDLARQVVGADYVQFYAAGTTLRLGQSAQLYDIEYQARLELQIIGSELQSYYAFITPPFLAWLFVPFSWLPYEMSFAVWSALGVLLLWLSLKWLGVQSRWKALGWCFTWYPVFAVISFGQNSLLSLAILSAAYLLWRRERRWAAGLMLSLILYKPQLVLGVALLWLLEWRKDWKTLAGLAVGGAALAALCFGLLPEASIAYLNFTRTILPDLPSWGQFPLWHLHTVRGFWRLLFGQENAWSKWLADGLWLLCAAAGTAAFWRFWQKKRSQTALLYAAAVCFTLWLTPHAMIYDWTILILPAALLWQTPPEGLRRTWRPIFALIWTAAFLSSALTFAQTRFLPAAIQISVPALAWALIAIYQTLTQDKA